MMATAFERELRTPGACAKYASSNPATRTLRLGFSLTLILLSASVAHAVPALFTSTYDDGNSNGVAQVRGMSRVHVYFNNGATIEPDIAEVCTSASSGDEVCQWAVRFETTGDLIIVDIGWEGMPVEDDEPSSPASIRNGTGGDAVFGDWGGTKLATVSLVGTNGELLVKTPAGFGFVVADGTVETLPTEGVAVAVAPQLPWATISTQDETACATAGNGELQCWGSAHSGSPPAGSYRMLATGSDSNGACALGFDNSISCWGGAASAPASDYLQIASGTDGHFCGLLPNLDVQCWGGFAGASATHVGPFSMVSRGGAFACAIRLDTTVECFGTIATPPANGGFVDLAGGDAHICGLLSDGDASCWGDSGSNARTTVTYPSLGAGEAAQYTEISSGLDHSCVIYRTIELGDAFEPDEVISENDVHCWGASIRTTLPAGKYLALSLNDPGGCGILDDSLITCWGTTGTTGDPSDVTYPIADAGNAHSCAITSIGDLSCWGADGFGQVSGAPVAGTFIQLDAGSDFNCAIEDDGTPSCWGDSADSKTTPPPATDFVQVIAGQSHACGLNPDATVSCWGGNTFGQSSAPAGSFLVLAAGMDHNCGVKDDLSLHCWGNGADSRTAAPSSGEFVDVRLGDKFGCARHTNGSVDCWGTGLGAATPAPGQFRDMGASGNGLCGTRANGAIECWGDSLSTTDPAPRVLLASLGGGGLAGVTSGADHSCGAANEGGLACWGDTSVASLTPPLDSDGDGLEDALDNCPTTDNGPAAGTCVFPTLSTEVACMLDAECSGGFCSRGQQDADTDGFGDACDACPDALNGTNADRDSDGVQDACDACVANPNGPLLGTCIIASGGARIGETCASDATCGGAVGACAMDQEIAACPPIQLYGIGVPGTPAAFSRGFSTMMAGEDDVYDIHFTCSTEHDIAYIDAGAVLPVGSVNGNTTVSFNTAHVDTTGGISFSYLGTEIANADPDSVFLSMTGAIQNGVRRFCGPDDVDIILATITVDTVPPDAFVAFSTDDFAHVTTHDSTFNGTGMLEAGVDTNTKGDEVPGEWLTGPPGAPVRIVLKRASEDFGAGSDRLWTIELHAQYELSRVYVVISNAFGAVYGSAPGQIEFVGCSAPGDPCAAGTGIGPSVDDTLPIVTYSSGVSDEMALDFHGTLKAESDPSNPLTSLLTIHDPTGIEKVTLGLIRMQEPTTEPLVDWVLGNMDRPNPADNVVATDLGASKTIAQVADVDRDFISNVTDNCLNMTNPDQQDRGGLGPGLEFGDGTGDLCQCGEVGGDGEILTAGDASDDSGDVEELLNLLSGLPTSGTGSSGVPNDRCNVSGDTPSPEDDPKLCDVKDAVVVALALNGRGPSIKSTACAASQAQQGAD